MILGFKPEFVDKILKGTKIHSIREDKNRRWRSGRKIHFATGVRTKNYKQFKLGFCVSVQTITMDFRVYPVPFLVDGKPLSMVDKMRLVANDGFEKYMDLFNFFGKPYDYYFSGVIIHWTSFKYHAKGGFTYGELPIVLDLPDEINNLASIQNSQLEKSEDGFFWTAKELEELRRIHREIWQTDPKPGEIKEITRKDLKEIRKKLRVNAIFIGGSKPDQSDHAFDALRYGMFLPKQPKKKAGLFGRLIAWIFGRIRIERVE